MITGSADSDGESTFPTFNDQNQQIRLDRYKDNQLQSTTTYIWNNDMLERVDDFDAGGTLHGTNIYGYKKCSGINFSLSKRQTGT